MAKRLPVTRPAPQIIHYADPVGGVQPMTERELLAYRRRNETLYANWVLRQAEIAERDRKVRRFWLGFGASLGVGVLAGLGLLVWAIASAGIGLFLAVPAALLALAGLAVGGHKCVTVVQHWH